MISMASAPSVSPAIMSGKLKITASTRQVPDPIASPTFSPAVVTGSADFHLEFTSADPRADKISAKIDRMAPVLEDPVDDFFAMVF